VASRAPRHFQYEYPVRLGSRALVLSLAAQIGIKQENTSAKTLSNYASFETITYSRRLSLAREAIRLPFWALYHFGTPTGDWGESSGLLQSLFYPHPHNKRIHMRALLASLLLLTSMLGHTQGSQIWPEQNSASLSQPEFLPVEEAYRVAIEIESDRSVRVYWQIEEAYYLYQHRFAFELEDQTGIVDLAVDFPPAIEREDDYFGKVKVYYRDADISLALQRVVEPVGRGLLKVSSQGCADAGLCYPPQTEYFQLDFATGAVSPAEAPRTAAASPSPEADKGAQSSGSSSLLYMMLLAFLGGAILNLMPCVFPILSLKLLSFARSNDGERHIHGWVYAAGVISSFVIVAAILISLQQAGNALGWGFQLQSPTFVIILAYLFVAMGLSLSGIIELGQGVMGVGSGLADKKGLSGSFFTGVLAVIVASPCTAPFMGTALGFALTQPPYIALAIFVALGAGMAAPLLLLSYSAGARNILPKPGPWMETLKQLLAFPLYATAIWLLWVAGRQTGVNTMALALVGALLLALGLWLWRYSGWRKGVALACLAGAILVGTGTPPETSSRADHTPWTEQQLTALRATGQAVFVDVTADWCITCIANEQTVLLSDEITEAFREHGVAYMVADWTHYNDDIGEYLQKHGRNGIPFYIMYPADPSAEPIILPQLLTKSVVLEALALAGNPSSEKLGLR
jgi:thiol:disulfide interchange protein